MKIAVNCRLLNPGKIGGMEGYVRNLLKYLLEIDSELEFILFVTRENEQTFKYPPDRVEKVLISGDGYGRKIFQTILDKKADLYFCPLLILEPAIVHIPTVITIPDVQHEIFPQFFQKEILQWRKLHFNTSASISSAVLTLSRFSAESISEKLKVPAGKVFPVHLAADESYGEKFDREKDIAAKKKYSLPDVYGFFPANTWPHKNHVTLAKALRIYKRKFGVVPKIVLTGARDSGYEDLNRAVSENDLEKDVVFLGYIPKDDMQCLYRNATFLVFPSLFEGFGMPVLEAMMSECPVICSNTSSLPEVAGESALFFDPLDADALAETIKKVMDNPDLRQRLIEEGRLQAQKFSWKRTAVETLAVFRELLSRAPSPASGQPLVSVVTPSYNQGDFIEETVLSVLSQDYPNIEYIVIDGGSKDRTKDILRKYDEKIRWVSEEDRGQADAVNKGFRVAEGEILGWLNSDDLYLPGAVRRVVEYFEDHPEAVMVYGNAYYSDRDSLITGTYGSEDFHLNRLAEICFICQPSVFIRAEALREVGELDVSLATCLDYDLWIRIAKKYEGRIRFMEDFLAVSRMYEENKTLSMREEVYDEIISTVRKYFGYVPDTWAHGYIVDVINGIHMKRHDRLRNPLHKLINWFYIARFLFRVRNMRLFTTVIRKTIHSGTESEALSYGSRFKGWRKS